MKFEELLNGISVRLKGLIHKIYISSSFLGEEDLYQEAVCHLWQRFLRNELMDKNHSYILKGCYFHLKNYQRVTLEKFNLVRTENQDEEAEEPAGPLDFVSDGRDHLEYLNARIFVSDMQNNGLTKREKDVFNLLLEELTVRQIASRLGISHVRVVKLQSHIKDKYRHKYGGYQQR